MNTNINFNQKQNFLETLKLNNHIQLKVKVKLVEAHYTKPIFAFVDEEFNVYIYLVYECRIIRAFNTQNLNDDYKVKNISFFFFENSKTTYENQALNENKKGNKLPYLIRENLLIIVVEKNILFFNIFTRANYKTITSEMIEKKAPIKAEVLNDEYLVILTYDGFIVLFNLAEWEAVKYIGKQQTIKPINYFIIARTIYKENILVLSNSNGTIFAIDLVGSKNSLKKLEGEKLEHDNPILQMEYNPTTEFICSISKNTIYIVSIRDARIAKKFKNFEYFNGNKPYGIVANTNFTNFPSSTYFIYGKTSAFTAIDLDLKTLYDCKVEQKDMKHYVSSVFDLESNIVKFEVKETKIYVVKTLYCSIKQYFLLGINKGLVILESNSIYKPKISQVNYLDQKNLYVFNSFEKQSSLIQYLYKKQNTKDNLKTGLWHGSQLEDDEHLLLNDAVFRNKNKNITHTVTATCFNDKQLISTYYKRLQILYSPLSNEDLILLATVDYSNNCYSVYELKSVYDNKGGVDYKVSNMLKNGSCSNFSWCPYDNMFAVSKYSTDKDKLGAKVSSANTTSFSLVVYRIKNNTVEVVYTLENIACHLIYSSHFIGVYLLNVKSVSDSSETRGKHTVSNSKENKSRSYFNDLVENNNDIDLTKIDPYFPGMTSFSNQSSSSKNMNLVFYSWNKKERANFMLTEEPINIISSNDLRFMIIIYHNKYVVYSIDSVSGETGNEEDAQSKLNRILENLSSNSNSTEGTNYTNKDKMDNYLNPIFVIYEEIIDAIIYEDFILIFITKFGVYFHILNHKNNYPIKLLKASQEFIKCNLKMDKFNNSDNRKTSADLIKPVSPPSKILSINKGKLVLAYSDEIVKIEELDHFLLKAVYSIKERDVVTLKDKIIPLIDKKYILCFISIISHYFSAAEEVFRRLFCSRNQISHFSLHHYLDCFLSDFTVYCSLPEEQTISDKLIRAKLVEYLNEKNLEGVLGVYNLASSNQLISENLSSTLIGSSAILKSLCTQNRLFEAIKINEHYNLNHNSLQLANQAIENLNKKCN